MTQLKSLNLRYNVGFGGAGLAHLKHLPHMEELSLRSCHYLGDGDIAPLGEMAKLRRLWLGGNISDAGLEHLKALKSLKELGLKDTKVTDRGAKMLQKAIPGLKVTR